MTRPLTQWERIALSPGGFHRRADMRRNNPANRASFDAWLEATRGEREGVPDLEPHCGNWIIVRRATGESVLETYSPDVARAVNQSAYAVFTAAQWLGAFNTAIRAGAADYGLAALESLLQGDIAP
jgi:hypothetical protein